MIVGWFPYAKDRTPMGGTATHKFPGANYNLSQQMKILYPEVDMELVGAPTGRDVRIFPGMLSHRELAYDRNIRDSEIFMRDAASTQITQAPVCANGTCEVKVRATNNSPHRFPSGLPDGRRAWISLVVKDSLGNPVYVSGYYDQNEAALYNDASKTFDSAYFAKSGTRFKYAQSPLIDTTAPGSKNAVMVYERRTGHQATPGDYVMSYDLSNIYIMFDNRIPYEGYEYAEFDANGLKLRKFDETTFVPSEDAARYPAPFPSGTKGFDEVTYRFPVGSVVGPFSARADLIAQTHTPLASNVAYAITPGGIPTPAPENLTVGLVGKTFVQLSWSDNSINEQVFYIERSANNGTTWSRVGTTPTPNTGTVATFQDNTVKAGTAYLYRVQAYNATGVSEYTNTVSATTLAR